MALFFFVPVGPSADSGTIYLFDGDTIKAEEVERMHFFGDGGIDYIELSDGGIVEGADIEGFDMSALGQGGVGGKGLSRDGDGSLYAGDGVGGGGPSRL